METTSVQAKSKRNEPQHGGSGQHQGNEKPVSASLIPDGGSRAHEARHFGPRATTTAPAPSAPGSVLVETDPGRLIRSYGDLVGAFVARRHAIQMSQADLDHAAGWCESFASKLEAWSSSAQGRTAGNLAMGLWFQAVGLVLLPVDVTPTRPGDGGAPLTLVELARKLDPALHARLAA